MLSVTISAGVPPPLPSRVRQAQSDRLEHAQHHLRRAAPQVLCSSSNVWADRRTLRDIYRLQTFPTLGHLVGYLLALLEGLESAACYPTVVNEDSFSAILWRDEAKALLVVEPRQDT
jgi:hypothetical protein